MRVRRDLKPFMRTVPTSSSLDFAEQIARLTGLDFDREAVIDQGLTLFESMFQELAAILKLPDDAIKFRSGYYFEARIFAAKDEAGTSQVSLDETFDYWLFALSHLTVIAMCEQLSEAEFQRLAQRVNETFLLFEDASRYQRVREGLKPYIADYAHLLNLSQALARAMLVFTICHELAHCRLEHLDRPADKAMELEADAIGAELFCKVVEFGHENSNTAVHVDPKVAGAPLALTRLLEFHERWLSRNNSGATESSTHPTAAERLAQVEPILAPHLDETARYVLEGFGAAVNDMESFLLGTPRSQ